MGRYWKSRVSGKRGRWAVPLVMAIAILLAGGKVRADNQLLEFVITPSPAPAASALAQDGSKITFSGRGTFVPGDPENVTGGGSWETFNSAGVSTASGNFAAIRLLKFDLAPGAVANPNIKGGLAFLQIAYSDGSQGVLAVSCHLPTTPPSVAEGIIASKAFVLYWNHVQASPTFFSTGTEDNKE